VLGSLLVTAFLCCQTLGTAQTAGRGRGKAIEFSEPKSNEITTNLHQLTSKKDSLKQLEEDLYKSLRTFSGATSLDGVPAAPVVRPPAGPVIPSKRARELLERHKNAYLMTVEDLAATPTAEEIFEIPEYDKDGLEKKKKTPIELYYERLDAKRAEAFKPAQADAAESFGVPGPLNGFEVQGGSSELEPMLPPGLKEKQEELQQYLAVENLNTTLLPTVSTRSSYSDIFGLGELAPSPEKVLEHKKFMEEFQNLLSPSSLPLPGAEVTGLPVNNTEPSPSSPAANPFGLNDTSTGDNSRVGAINPVLIPASPLDVNEQVVIQPSPISQALKVTPVTKPPSAPTFAAPRRPF